MPKHEPTITCSRDIAVDLGLPETHIVRWARAIRVRGGGTGFHRRWTAADVRQLHVAIALDMDNVRTAARLAAPVRKHDEGWLIVREGQSWVETDARQAVRHVTDFGCTRIVSFA